MMLIKNLIQSRGLLSLLLVTMGEIDIILAHSQTTGVRAAAQKGSLEVQDEV